MDFKEIKVAVQNQFNKMVKKELNSLYRGAEKLPLLQRFAALKKSFKKLRTDKAKDLFVWESLVNGASFVSRIRNDVIGTLLVDLSEGRDRRDADGNVILGSARGDGEMSSKHPWAWTEGPHVWQAQRHLSSNMYEIGPMVVKNERGDFVPKSLENGVVCSAFGGFGLSICMRPRVTLEEAQADIIRTFEALSEWALAKEKQESK